MQLSLASSHVPDMVYKLFLQFHEAFNAVNATKRCFSRDEREGQQRGSREQQRVEQLQSDIIKRTKVRDG